MYSVIVKTEKFKKAIKACVLGLDMTRGGPSYQTMFRFTVTGGGVAIQAGGLATAMIRVFVKNANEEIENKEIDVAVSAAKLDGISNIPILAEETSIYYSEESSILTIIIGDHRIELPVAKQVFPEIEIDDATIIDSTEVIKHLPVIVKFCDDGKPVSNMSRVFFNFKDRQIASTDSKRLAVAQLSHENKYPLENILIDMESVAIVHRALAFNENLEDFSTMSLSKNASMVTFSIGQTMVSVRSSGNDYYKYGLVINQLESAARTYYSFDRKGVVDALKTAKLMYKSPEISTHLEVGNELEGKATMMSKDVATSEIVTSFVDYKVLVNERYQSTLRGPIRMIFATGLLQSIVGNLEGVQFVLEVVNSTTGALIREGSMTYVIMPRQL